MMSEHDCIIFGGRLHEVGINELSLIKRNLPALTGKRLIAFATGASPESETVLAMWQAKT
ncbi:MAG: hypothetical protein ACOX8S_10950 [Christensenellales bacterium]|jgi:hypothetical protein